MEATRQSMPLVGMPKLSFSAMSYLLGKSTLVTDGKLSFFLTQIRALQKNWTPSKLLPQNIRTI